MLRRLQLSGKPLWRRSMNDTPEQIRGIVAFDLDGTLLRGDTVCEILAKPLGRLEDMKRFEAFRTETEIVAARKQMAGWYRGSAADRLQASLSHVSWAPGAHEAIQQLHAAGIAVGIASITWKFAVRWCADRLGVRHYLGTDLTPEGDILHVWGRDKARWLKELADSHGIRKNRIAAVGDSRNDFEMLRVASLRFFVGEKPLPGIGSLVHLPAADLRAVAAGIIDEWAA